LHSSSEPIRRTLRVDTAMNEPVAIAILAKAPVPGFAKTRLIPVLGAKRAALLQARLIERAIETASRSAVGPVTLWATPDDSDPLFRALRTQHGLALARQGEGALGARMLTAMTAVHGPVLVMGTDCPALTREHLRAAADILRRGTDVVILPAEDGGYVVIGMRAPQPAVFEAPISWGSARVIGETRRRLRRLRLTWQEPFMLWDIDLPADVERLRTGSLQDLLSCPSVLKRGTSP
jgi:rSAM/selenodomain-associated transferase 1